MAQRWRQFAEQRRIACAELYESGNWKKHYTEDEFRLRMREVVSSAKRWNEIAPSAPDEAAAPTSAEVESKSRRTAA